MIWLEPRLDEQHQRHLRQKCHWMAEFDQGVVQWTIAEEVGLELAIDPPPLGGILYTMIFWNYII